MRYSFNIFFIFHIHSIFINIFSIIFIILFICINHTKSLNEFDSLDETYNFAEITIFKSKCPPQCECEENFHRRSNRETNEISVNCHTGGLSQEDFAYIIKHISDKVTILDIEAPRTKPNQLLWDDNLNRLTRLRTLRLINCGIPAISRVLRLPKLEILDLRGNRIEHITISMFSGVPSIRTLNLAENLLSILPTGAFTYLRQMEALFLSYNNITELSANLFRGLETLKALHLDGNKIPSYQINNVISDISQLEQLELNYCGINSIRQVNLNKLISLRKLGLAGNSLKIIPTNDLRNLPWLSSLNLADNDIRGVAPYSFASTNITRLSLAHNKLGQSPFSLKIDSFAHMNLLELDLSYNGHEYFDSFVLGSAQLTIETLHLSGNGIRVFHEHLTSNMSSLKHLHLADNNISQIPANLPFEYSQLTFLNLSNNELTDLPQYSRYILPALRILDISSNRISSLSMNVLDSFINDLDQV
ncbi:unnamed protein product [Dracunculus medinensis]|uniref:LRRNT domain-containing protein n=1 Tax=Dracunculus medinensis TaxID=318479 RepID=A0A0N4UBM9_DRAME|nr:unnamed protein product [Dracunculus medinensis]